jgi:hypothetical protein
VANWVFTVKDATTGKPIANARVSGTVGTNPCATYKVFGVTYAVEAGCTSGAGYEFSGYTDNSGSFRSNIPYTCKQNLNATISAVGYNDYPVAYNSGSISGDCGFAINMTPSAFNGGALATPPGQGPLAGAGQAAAQAGMVGNSIFTTLQGLGDWVIVVIVAVAVIVVVLLLLLLFSRAPVV